MAGAGPSFVPLLVAPAVIVTGFGYRADVLQLDLRAVMKGVQAMAGRRRVGPVGVLESRTGTSPGMLSAISTQ